MPMALPWTDGDVEEQEAWYLKDMADNLHGGNGHGTESCMGNEVSPVKRFHQAAPEGSWGREEGGGNSVVVVGILVT